MLCNLLQCFNTSTDLSVLLVYFFHQRQWDHGVEVPHVALAPVSKSYALPVEDVYHMLFVKKRKHLILCRFNLFSPKITKYDIGGLYKVATAYWKQQTTNSLKFQYTTLGEMIVYTGFQTIILIDEISSSFPGFWNCLLTS